MNQIEKTRLKLKEEGKKLIDLSCGNANNNGIFFDKSILKKACGEFLENPAYIADPKGVQSAREAVSLFYRRRGFAVDKNQIVLTSGTSEGYFHLFKTLASAGDRILFPNPSYPLFEEIARLAEIRLAFYPLEEKNGWKIDAGRLKKLITKKTKAIVLISPNNPTGAVLDRKCLESVLDVAAEKNLPLISDEVFSEFVFGEKEFPRLAEIAAGKSAYRDVKIYTLSGVSKTYALPGLKLGWIVVSGPDWPKRVDLLERPVDAFLSCSQTAQSMLPSVISEGEPFIGRFRDYVEKNAKMAEKILSAHSCFCFHKPEGAFYLFLKIKGLNLTDESFAVRLMKEKNIYVHPGYFYDYDKGLYILISLLSAPEILRHCLEEIVDLVNAL